MRRGKLLAFKQGTADPEMPQLIQTHARFALTLLLSLLATSSARAQVHIAGESGAVRVEVQDASVEDVLAALSESFGLRYRSTMPLQRRISGSHDGELARVIARVLDGYDFVLKVDSQGVDVTVYGPATPQEASVAPKQNASASGVAATPSNSTKTPSAKSRHEARRKRHAY